MKKCLFFIIVLLYFYPGLSFAEYQDIKYDQCHLKKKSYDLVIDSVISNKKTALSSLAGCLRFNHRLIFHACLIDPSQLQYSENLFKDNENFVLSLIKIHPRALKYASKRLRNDQSFVKRITYIYREAIKYADKKLLDNKNFMAEMIKYDSRNYIFASKRIRSSFEHAKLAFQDNGSLLIYAPESVRSNKELVKIALNSSLEAFYVIDPKLALDPQIANLLHEGDKALSHEKLEKYITKTYLTNHKEEVFGKKLNYEKEPKFKNNIIINRNYITKWHEQLKFNDLFFQKNWVLTPAKNRNLPHYWQEDLKKYPDLVKKIEKFLAKRLVDLETSNNLYLTYLWKVKDKPLTLALNLYMLRAKSNYELNYKYVNVTDLSIIAQKTKSGWQMSVVRVLMDKDIKTDISYDHGHKRYFLQDLYLQSEDDKNPKIIYRIESEFSKYFEIYEEMHGGKYHMIYRLNPLKMAKATKSNNYNQHIKNFKREDLEEQEWLKNMEECAKNYKCAKKIGNFHEIIEFPENYEN